MRVLKSYIHFLQTVLHNILHSLEFYITFYRAC
uniref:Uncharacterized protein n=1 Tax=Anguilla anguilla TaxID=7936 RepID=A0A0E9P7G2_ANGAN